MFAEMLAIVIKILINNHVYTFGGELYVQEGNGSIGDRATGIIAQIVMRWWDQQFKNKLRELKINFDLIERWGLWRFRAWNAYKDGKLSIYKEKANEDRDVPDDKRTMEVIKNVANDIKEMVQMTVDVPSNHTDLKLPVLI